MLLLALYATLCGCDTFHDMTVYGEEKLTLLQQILPFVHGIPCLVAWVDSCGTVKGETSQDRRYFVSSLSMDAV